MSRAILRFVSAFSQRTGPAADFSLVRRRAALTGSKPDLAALLRLLAAECEGRTGGRLPMGFVPGAGE